VLLFEIATSVALFQEKLPRATIRRLQVTSFETKEAAETLELMFKAVTSPRESRVLYVGPTVSKMLLDRQMEHTQSAQAFIGSLKVCVVYAETGPL
jgi:origin recognition complex subunit 3